MSAPNGSARAAHVAQLSCARLRHQICEDTLPEWSKGVDPSSTSASCVGSNPAGVNAFEWLGGNFNAESMLHFVEQTIIVWLMLMA